MLKLKQTETVFKPVIKEVLLSTHPKKLVGVNDDPKGVANYKKDDDGYERDGGPNSFPLLAADA